MVNKYPWPLSKVAKLILSLEQATIFSKCWLWFQGIMIFEGASVLRSQRPVLLVQGIITHFPSIFNDLTTLNYSRLIPLQTNLKSSLNSMKSWNTIYSNNQGARHYDQPCYHETCFRKPSVYLHELT